MFDFNSLPLRLIESSKYANNYKYEREYLPQYNDWDLTHNPLRIDQFAKNVNCAKEIEKALPDKKFILYAGYADYKVYVFSYIIQNQQDWSYVTDSNGNIMYFETFDEAQVYADSNSLTNVCIYQTKRYMKDELGNDIVFITEDEANLYIENSSLIGASVEAINNELKVLVQFEVALSEEEKQTLDTVISNHKNNICFKFAVFKSDGSMVEDPGSPGSAYLFNTEELAQQFIVSDGLEGAIVKGVVVL